MQLVGILNLRAILFFYKYFIILKEKKFKEKTTLTLKCCHFFIFFVSVHGEIAVALYGLTERRK